MVLQIEFLVILASVSNLLAIDNYSQVARISLDMESESLELIMDEIENPSEFYFIFNQEQTDVNKVADIHVSDGLINDVLPDLLNYAALDSKILLTTEHLNNELLLESLSVDAQQQISVSGTVTDSQTGETMPGVNIVVKGTTIGVVSDIAGYYSLTVPDRNATLVFSFIGYTSQEIPMQGSTEINVALVLESKLLEGVEVVAIGYGTRNKRFVSGSISSVSVKEMQQLPNLNIGQSLITVPGVQFISDARPGQSGVVLIRGQNSLSASNTPLIVLDGIIFEGELTDINPQDIASIDVLKDASSASIYGSRAANGVILITSVKGDAEKPVIRFNTFYGMSQPERWIKLLTAERYIERRLDFREQMGVEADPNNITDYLNQEEVNNYTAGISNNPFDIVSQDGRLFNFDLSVSGKTALTNYLFSASMSDEQGLIINDQQKRYTFRLNLDNQITEWLNVGVVTNYSHRDRSGQVASLNNAYRNSPLGTWYYPNGEPTLYPVPDETASTNPLHRALLTTDSKIYENLFSNLYSIIDVPFIEGLSYRFNLSPNIRWSHDYNFYRKDPNLNYNNSSARKTNSNTFQWVLENIVTYDKSIGDHDFDLTLLYGLSQSKMESTTANSDQLHIDFLGYNALELGTVLTNSSYGEEQSGVSFMARLNYMYKQKYILTLTGRRDGSSVFAKENKYATFPSAALAWIVTEEPFMGNIEFIEFLKLRISYGSVGNEAISPYQSLSMAQVTRSVFGERRVSTLGAGTSTLGNDRLKWETVYSSNVGVDFGLFERRVNGSIEFYNNVTKDLLVRRVIPVMSGYSSIMTNIGETNNRGIDLSLNTFIIQKSKFDWSTSLTFSYNRNKITKLFGDINNDGKEDDVIANNWFIGYPINSYYDYVFDGIYQVGDDIPTGYKPGDVRVKDIDGEEGITTNDRKVVGSGVNPVYSINFNNSLKYGNLSLFVSMNAMLDWIAPFNLINQDVPGRALGAMDAGWWTTENKSQTRPSLIYRNPLGTSWYVSRDFLRIRDISLSYDFHNMDLDILSGFSSLRLIMSVKNLHTFTKWLGSDPESGGDYTDFGGSDDIYPMPRSISLGLNVGF